jgi:hypothetical protein
MDKYSRKKYADLRHFTACLAQIIDLREGKLASNQSSGWDLRQTRPSNTRYAFDEVSLHTGNQPRRCRETAMYRGEITERYSKSPWGESPAQLLVLLLLPTL